MASSLKEHFLMGYREGWRTFWSPFTGLWQSLKQTWRDHKHLRG